MSGSVVPYCKRDSPCVQWCFTLNNYTDDEVSILDSLHPQKVKYLVYGFEKGESGTPHLQGYMQCVKKQRLTALKKLLPKAHWEAAKGSPAQNRTYCTKENNFKEYGTAISQGKRCDLESYMDAVKDGATWETLTEGHPLVLARYRMFCTEYFKNHQDVAPLKDHPLRVWQSELYSKLQLPANDREIIFLVDYKGNSGKSWFAKYYRSLHPENTQVLEIAKKADIAYQVKPGTRVFFFDCKRETQEFAQYSTFEALKDGFIISPKYESCMVMLSFIPHVVVMMNQQPDRSKLSEDRYTIIEV
jgi:hypothetical protein